MSHPGLCLRWTGQDDPSLKSEALRQVFTLAIPAAGGWIAAQENDYIFFQIQRRRSAFRGTRSQFISAKTTTWTPVVFQLDFRDWSLGRLFRHSYKAHALSKATGAVFGNGSEVQRGTVTSLKTPRVKLAGFLWNPHVLFVHLRRFLLGHFNQNDDLTSVIQAKERHMFWS